MPGDYVVRVSTRWIKSQPTRWIKSCHIRLLKSIFHSSKFVSDACLLSVPIGKMLYGFLNVFALLAILPKMARTNDVWSSLTVRKIKLGLNVKTKYTPIRVNEMNE